MVLEKLSDSLKNTLAKIAKSLFVDEKLINELVKDIQIQLMDKYTPYINVYNYKSFVARYSYVRDFIVDPSGNPNSQGQMWLNV